MTYKTHFIGGICATGLASMVMPIENLAVVGAVSAVSAFLPDIDIEGSKVNNKAGIVGKGISSVSKHRGFIHTPILYIALYYVMSMFLPMSVCQGFLIGTISHLILDTFNYKGIMWLYPISRKHFHIASIKTRSFAESVFTVIMVVITAVLFVNDTVSASTIVDMFAFNMPEVSNIEVSAMVDKCQQFVEAMLTF